MSKFAKIAAAFSAQLLEETVPEWGGEKLFFRKLDGERLLSAESVREHRNRHAPPESKGKPFRDLPEEQQKYHLRTSALFHAAVIASTALDEEGKPVFVGAAQRAFLEDQDHSLLRRLSLAIQRYSGVAGESPVEEGEEAEENSAKAAADPTDSPGSASTTKKPGRGKPASDGSSPGG